MHIPAITVHKTNLLGYSCHSEKQLLDKLFTQDFSSLYGDFIYIVEGQVENNLCTIFLTSAINANPYFYTIESGRIVHGANVFDVFSGMKAPLWKWNYEAFYRVCNIDHTIAEETIHQDIFRVPAASLLVHMHGQDQAEIISIASPFSFNQIDAAAGVKLFGAIVPDYIHSSGKYALSLSAGMDSRLLLATCFKQGIQPVTATMGHADATDVRIANAIAKDFKLEHQVISLESKDFLNENFARQIVLTSSGTKSFAHWHTHIYTTKLGFGNGYTHLAGANGETARAYYFNKGIFSKMLQYGNFGAFKKFWGMKLDHGNQFVASSVKNKIDQAQVLKQIVRCCDTVATDADKFDWFYAFERVRNFIANGMALYNLRYKTISPMLDERFLRMAFSLKRKYKLNSVLHKKLIGAFCPDLLKYPNADNTADIKSMGTNFYFLQKENVVQYHAASKALEENYARELLMESKLLHGWTNQQEIENWYQTKNYRALAMMYVLHFTLVIINETEKGKADS